PVVGAGNGNGPFTGGTLMHSQGTVTSKTLASILTALATGSQAKQKQQQTLEQVAKQIQKAANDLGLGGKVQTKQRNNGLEVTLLTDKVLFDSGAADIRVGGQPLLEAVEA